jgi:hypothetical protein
MKFEPPNMTDTEKLQFLLTQLQETAAREHCVDAEHYDASNSLSFDNAFADGEDYGEVEYARLLLAKLAKGAEGRFTNRLFF